MKVIIVGGVAGGMSAATRLRRLSEDAEIVVLERGNHVSFANCGLPYHVGGLITERDDLLLQTPDSLAARSALDVRVRSEVVAIDAAARTVTVRERPAGAHDGAAEPAVGAGESGREYTESYDELVLSPGARPVVPPVPGADRALTLRDVDDVDRLVAATADARTAVIVGGGFIGIELAENLSRRGLDVTIVELADQVLAPLDPEMTFHVEQSLTAHGVRLELGRSISAIEAGKILLDDGRAVPADLVVMAIGVRPETHLAELAGATIGQAGGILVDEDLRTTVEHVYALGDAAQKTDALTGEGTLIPLANLANRHGRHVADVIMGGASVSGAGEAGRGDARTDSGAGARSPRGSAGTAVVGLFDLVVASTGWNEKRLRRAGRTPVVIHTHPAHRAGYYPGAQGMHLKLLVDPETDRILGAQAVGGAGVDKRIDVLATAMAAGLTASALADLELAYAPQFGSAKDPVNMLGYVADNLRTGRTRTLQWHELDAALAPQPAGEAAGEAPVEAAVLVDVRTPGEHAARSIPGAVNIPLDDLRTRAGELTGRRVVVHCAVGQRGHTAARLLTGLGYDVRNLDGGMATWTAGTSRTAHQHTSPQQTSHQQTKETHHA